VGLPDAKHHIRHDSRGFKERHRHRFYESDRERTREGHSEGWAHRPNEGSRFHWEFHGDPIGISESLYVFDAGVAAGYAGGLPDGEAAALADYMIFFVDTFSECHDTNGTAPKEHVQANRNKLAKQFLDVESDVRDLCRAVKVVSWVVYDQLVDPTSGEPFSRLRLEVQTFDIDSEVLRFAVDRAADLALAVSHKMLWCVLQEPAGSSRWVSRSGWANSAAFLLLRGDFSALIRGLGITIEY
jgi:hypothetical protein